MMWATMFIIATGPGKMCQPCYGRIISIPIVEDSNNKYFEVVRSFDGYNFNSIAVVRDEVTANGGVKSYGITDWAAALQNKNVIYRLKQVDNTDKFSYSNIIVLVKLQADNVSGMQASPNPLP